jgi:hypothetical protein
LKVQFGKLRNYRCKLLEQSIGHERGRGTPEITSVIDGGFDGIVSNE